MKKIVILGCENSHSDAFLKLITTKEEYSDVQVLGVYSDEPEPASKRTGAGICQLCKRLS